VLPDTAEPFPTPSLVAEETGPLPEQQAWLQLIRTAQVLGQPLGTLFDAHGISGRQYNVLRALRRAGQSGLTAGEVARQLTDPAADTTRLVDRLVRDGLARRSTDARDRRAVRVHLTEAGAALLARLDAPLLAVHRDQFGHMAPAELATLVALLRKARREPAVSAP
jgi:DNA-binding MarR family transcriptional regulator